MPISPRPTLDDIARADHEGKRRVAISEESNWRS
jgi:hypothetical protein